MNARELATVLLKVMGLYLILSALLMAPNVVALRSASADLASVGGQEAIYTTQLLTALFLLGVGGTLLFATQPIVTRLFPLPAGGGRPLNSFSVQAVGLSLVGAWLLAYALPSLASSGILLLALSKGGRELERAEYLRANWLTMVQPVFEAAVGLWLFFGSRGFAATWHKLHQSPAP
jgi:hypothetical protein